MERYLLFESKCSFCTKLAQDIERESDGQLIARSLRDPDIQSLLEKADPNWQWQPTLLEIEAGKIKVTTGVALTTKIVQELGLRRAWRIVKLLNEANSVSTYRNKERRQFLKQSGALLAAVPVLGLSGLHKNFSLVEEPLPDWQIYRDRDFGFTLEYSQNWYAEIKEQQPTPLLDDEAILKRIVFSFSPALVYLDVWMSKDKTLPDWLNWYKETRQVDEMPTEANAIVAQQSAATFLQEHQRSLLLTYLSDGQYVYRLMNWMTSEPKHLDIYWHMLDTLTLSGVSTSIVNELPLAIKLEASRSFRQIPGLAVANCCSYYSGNNPFPCCNDGNCTWWCYYKYGYVPFTGNAGTWWGQAGDHAAWSQSSYPRIGGGMSIACWSGSPGHVAHTNYWSGNGNVSITEMSWCESCENARNIPYTTPTQGWIFANYI